ncbi:2-oxo acid dehydrogenase subunit E2 [Enterobacteriaceae endosymbiont of Macroplea appendiculata]|uniref:2-oxo acid dehydrogenase subunit E2 n=1 Tax=Enterobacteriaceae endosymbiont of Macroplea appendiculata TaxID=2675790 RepID=UPI0014499A96|nr:2-oxo acid dehydrogenase subunit E2 [Enterobacteriaceae endosymbiont of Macroplea appendiculata]QJC30817.1 dihydrolipoamide succinyltransferase [Enterobacteriaceae endosymbiont of Macroplea appendiculata]
MNNINIIVPELPESVNNAIIIQWHKKPGDIINIDDVLVDLETDKIVLEIPATVHGILKQILVSQNSKVQSQQIIGVIEQIIQNNDINIKTNTSIKNYQKKCIQQNKQFYSPSTRRKMSVQNNILQDIQKNKPLMSEYTTLKNKKRIPMTPIRQQITKQLMLSKNNTITLTTFNEVNMEQIQIIRKKYASNIQQEYQIKLGFMPFYIKASAIALKKYPQINAYIDNQDIIYNDTYHINIAIATQRGLITPIIKNTDILSIISLEKKIQILLCKSNNNKLTLDELSSGTFTITNGGVFGSLMSTPIINPPQSAILGIHAIQNRPIVINKEICIMPMTYLALSYDHRLIDGKEAISFLVYLKKLLEDPIILLLNM